MGRYVIEDPSTRRFEIDESALPFWEHREGHKVIGPAPEPGEETAKQDDEIEPAQSAVIVPPQSEESGISKPNKAASRPAQIKE
ncbi:hypothetical protein AB0F88_40195 [Streptosporangium sp. NPDC023963]|uniref:hypothetical protein n=1 Tax=Streptosporangium sp. NPDC023963 TaxID=3155608 RepID=UPI003449D83F